VEDLTLDLLSRKVTRGGKPIDLRPREFALLEYLMRNAGKVVSKTMILSHVWEYNFDSADQHRRRAGQPAAREDRSAVREEAAADGPRRRLRAEERRVSERGR
jgi:hypothetical protein